MLLKIIIFFTLINTINLICINNRDYCSCHVGPKGDYEIKCPLNENRNRLMINVEPTKYIYIRCTYETKVDDYQLIPQLNIKQIKQVRFNSCPLTDNQTFIQIFKQLGLDQVDHILFQTFGTSTPKIHRYQLEQLVNLTQLELAQSDLDSDILYNLTDLHYINLFESKTELNNDFFKYNKNLTRIDLGNIELKNTNIPSRVFYGLKQLKQLNLWSLNLPSLNPEIFNDLTSLQILDLHRNNLSELDSNVFNNLTSLRVINLNQNNFYELPTNLFKNHIHLEEFKLSYNLQHTLKLPDELLADLPNLKQVYIESSNLMELPENIFKNSFQLANISLADNLLENLFENTFRDCTNLYNLNLQRNRLRTLPTNLFKHLENLHVINLQYNQLISITSTMFVNQVKLIEINMANNAIDNIEKDAFARTVNLEKIDFSNNNLSLRNYYYSPFTNLNELRILNLSNNTIERIADDWRLNKLDLKLLNLRYNRIRYVDFASLQFVSRGVTIDLRNNKIAYVDLTSAEGIAQQQGHILDAISSSGRNKSTTVLISDNPVYCDCGVYNLLRYFEGRLDSRVRAMVEIVPGNLTCVKPNNFINRNLLEVHSKEITCPFADTQMHNCPAGCGCFIRFLDKSIHVNCSNRNLTQLPNKLPKFRLYPNIVLYMSNNNLNEINFRNQSVYVNLIELYVDNNNISKIISLPEQLRVLDLHSNQFNRIDVKMLQQLSNLTKLLLNDNPWSCDCDGVELMSFVQEQYQIFLNRASIMCTLNGEQKSLTQLTSDDLCPFPTTAIVTLATTIVLLSVLVTVFLVIFYRNEEAIKVWLFAHNKCLWWITEEELDKNKKYDAFVSYANGDEDFIVKQLLPNLEERGDKRYRLCIHKRDWIGGEWIPNQIARSIEESKRTLVVLSPNFLQSVWGKMEFRSAHMTSLREGRARVIIIKYQDIGSYDNLDPELRAYLTMNTYIEWGDRNFWDKLRYALPHPPPLNKRAELILQRMKQSLGDKLEMPHNIITTAPPSTIPLNILTRDTNSLKLDDYSSTDEHPMTNDNRALEV